MNNTLEEETAKAKESEVESSTTTFTKSQQRRRRRKQKMQSETEKTASGGDDAFTATATATVGGDVTPQRATSMAEAAAAARKAEKEKHTATEAERARKSEEMRRALKREELRDALHQLQLARQKGPTHARLEEAKKKAEERRQTAAARKDRVAEEMATQAEGVKKELEDASKDEEGRTLARSEAASEITQQLKVPSIADPKKKTPEPAAEARGQSSEEMFKRMKKMDKELHEYCSMVRMWVWKVMKPYMCTGGVYQPTFSFINRVYMLGKEKGKEHPIVPRGYLEVLIVAFNGHVHGFYTDDFEGIAGQLKSKKGRTTCDMSNHLEDLPGATVKKTAEKGYVIHLEFPNDGADIPRHVSPPWWKHHGTYASTLADEDIISEAEFLERWPTEDDQAELYAAIAAESARVERKIPEWIEDMHKKDEARLKRQKEMAAEKKKEKSD